ncbi:MAG: after-VIT domain-containing protein [Cyanobacteria bacterium CRU_2_1]|nr:after-VIT domain-containing protein [Cyanobacteria bacterium RU_5_0]NJR61908.1 after-VIT domain-containing protein [Cyanobacteria bacterium CRU_2_1]
MTQIQLDRQPGGLYVQTADQQPIAFPLKHTEVNAKVAGNLSRVEVIQTFENPFTTILEATYIFPLPDEAAVDDMVIRIGDRTIQGSIKKRQEAQQIYEQAKQEGRTAGLLEQERDNIFTQSLANIKPGEQIDVIIRYTDSLKFEGGDYEFVFPMVIGPRYIPGTTIEKNVAGGGSATAPMTLNQDTDLVPDASRLNAPILPPGTRSGHDIGVTIEIDAGVVIQDVRSPSHQLQIEHEGQIVRVKLTGGDTIPNKDLIMRYRVSGDRTQTTLLTQADDRGGHFALYLIPALQYRPDQVVPKDVVFLIDTSGSQMGDPLLKCQELMRRFINGLNPDDTFNIMDFSDTTRQLSPVPLANTAQNRTRAINYVNQLNAGGGTEMLRGIRAVLNFPVVDPGRLRSIVLLTDGYIGNENQILAEVQHHLKPGNRLYSFGAGSSVNRFLLNRIAEIGRGISRIVRHDEPTDEVTEKFFRQINNPVLTNIQLRWEGDGKTPVIYPFTLPDLFAEQPLVLFGRQDDRTSGKLHITGNAIGGAIYQQTFALNFEEPGNVAIAQRWGRSRIKDLMNQMVSGETKVGVEAVTDTALIYQLLSQYTAFVAVSDEIRVDPTQGSVSVQVPVSMPEGVSYEGVFGNIAQSMLPQAMSYLASPDYAAPGEMTRSAKLQVPHPARAAFSPPSPPSAPSTLSPSTPAAESMLAADQEEGMFSRVRRFVQDRLKPSEKSSSEESWSLMSEDSDRLQVLSATGLTQQAIDVLTQHLQAIQFPTGFSGDLVFELQISKGRVRQVILDEQASTLQEQAVIEIVRRSLLTWYPPQPVRSPVHLVLRIQ